MDGTIFIGATAGPVAPTAMGWWLIASDAPPKHNWKWSYNADHVEGANGNSPKALGVAAPKGFWPLASTFHSQELQVAECHSGTMDGTNASPGTAPVAPRPKGWWMLVSNVQPESPQGQHLVWDVWTEPMMLQQHL